MSTIELILRSDFIKILVNVLTPIFGVMVLAMFLILVLHTAYLLGKRSVLYHSRDPVPDWSKRFYPATILLIVGLLIIMWALNAWSHAYWR